MTETAMLAVGVISDTHGLLRQSALAALRGCSPIIHAGDVGDEAVLEGLREIAPVFAVRGNIDRGDLGRRLPANQHVEIGGCGIYVLHDLTDLDLDPAAAGFSAIIHGHSHRPGMMTKEGVLYLNPGSAGPRRFSLPITVARLKLIGGKISAEIIEIAA
jgi:putative phosphoesterase